MPTAIIYIRVSTDEQIAGTSLATQEADCRTWCERNGHEVAELFRDEGESAKTADRPGLLAAIGRVRAGGIDAFVAWKLDRVARNATDGLAIRADLRRRNCRLVSATEAVTDDPVGEMVGTVLLAVAQFDNQVRAQRCRRGMRERAAAGAWCFQAPVGFLLDRTGQIPILKPDPATAPVITEAFVGLASGRMRLSDAVVLLRSIGMPDQTASRVLRNPVYGGIIRGALTDDKEVKAAFPGLVAPDVWREAQQVLKPYRTKLAGGRGPFTLVGVALCEVCGGTIRGAKSIGRNGLTYGYYDCKHSHVRMRSETAHTELRAILSGECAPAIANLRVLVARDAAAEADVGRAARMAAERRQASAESRLSRLADGYADGVLDAATYQAKAGEYRQEIKSAIYDAKVAQGGVQKMLAGLDKIVETMSDPWVLWQRLDTKARKDLLNIFGVRLVITRDGICRNASNPDNTSGLAGVKPPVFANGRPGGSRTRDPKIRNLVLCPSELLACENCF